MRLILYKIYKVVLDVVAFFFGTTSYKKIVVIGQARTGSNLLLSYLNSHRNIKIEGELFGYLRGKSIRDVWDSAFGNHVPWIRWFGFKIFYEQPLDSHDKEVWNLIEKDKEIFIIQLNRENILRTYLSHKIATQNGQWTKSSLSRKAQLNDKKIDIDIADCLSYIKETQLNESVNKTRFAQHQFYELTYEQLVEEPEVEMGKIFTSMNLKDTGIQTKMMKQNPESIRDLVLNYSALSDALAGTEYEHFLIE